jgi:chemotaxis protein MotA
MFYLIGLITATVSVYLSIFYLRQSPDVYFDFVAVFIVMGGTSAVAIMTFPWEHRKEIVKALRQLLFTRESNLQDLSLETMQLIRAVTDNQPVPTPKYAGLPGDVLRDGAELIGLGFSADKIQAILEERIRQASDNDLKIANSFRSLAKYPPAFGLVGTVLSLVSVMRSVSTGATAQDTGMRMAVALVATFYGLLVSNLIVAPAGEAILKASIQEQKEAEMALQAVMLAVERVSLLEAQEMMNSFIPREQRLNLLFMDNQEQHAEESQTA